VTYKFKGDAEEKKLEFPFKFPCSSFVIPAPIDATTFIGLLRSDAKEAKTSSLATTLCQGCCCPFFSLSCQSG